MATTDPAGEAAQQAVAGVPSAANRSEPHRWAAAGAREALAPIRDLYEKWSPWLDHPDAHPQFSNGMALILGDLAPLIYTSEELQ